MIAKIYSHVFNQVWVRVGDQMAEQIGNKVFNLLSDHFFADKNNIWAKISDQPNKIRDQIKTKLTKEPRNELPF